MKTTAKEARSRTNASKAVITNVLNAAERRILNACDDGKYEVWIEIPMNSELVHEIETELMKNDFYVGNRQEGKLWVSWKKE